MIYKHDHANDVIFVFLERTNDVIMLFDLSISFHESEKERVV